jgi:hypothetical protein
MKQVNFSHARGVALWQILAAILVATIADCPPIRADFVQGEFRSADGTTYQVLRALAPIDVATGGKRIRVTTLGAAALDTGYCYTNSVYPQNLMLAIAGVVPPHFLHPITDIRRSGVVVLSDSSLAFDPSGSGRVTFGTAAGAQNVCSDAADCSGQPHVRPVFSAKSSAAGLPAACVADLPSPCGAIPPSYEVLAFGLQALDNNLCETPTDITTATSRCAPEPTDGFTLQEGQGVVFIYGSSCDTDFWVSSAGFFISADNLNPQLCDANEVVGTTGVLQTAPKPDAPCVPAPLCRTTPRLGCRTSGKSVVQLKDDPNDTKDKLSWRWDQGALTGVNAFGDPVNGSTDYAFCLYQTDKDNPVPMLAMRAEIPAGGKCGTSSCWSVLPGGVGLQYTDAAATEDGIQSVLLQAGPAGAAKVELKGGGVNLPIPAPFDANHLIGENPAVTAQLVNRLGQCWESKYVLPAAASTVSHFKDKY